MTTHPALDHSLSEDLIGMRDSGNELELHFACKNAHRCVTINLPSSQIGHVITRRGTARVRLSVTSNGFSRALGGCGPPGTTTGGHRTAAIAKLFRGFATIRAGTGSLRINDLYHCKTARQRLSTFFSAGPTSAISRNDTTTFTRCLQGQIIRQATGSCLALIGSY